jgi:hypothetical protein
MAWHHKMNYALLRQLTRHGWRRVRVEHRTAREHTWEVWEVQSPWGPRVVRAFLLLWNDPAVFGRRVLVTRERPAGDENLPWTGAIYLGWHWRTTFHSIVGALERLRSRTLAGSAVPAEVGTQGTEGGSRAAGSVCGEVENRLRLVRGRLSDRQFRLFACGCLRLFRQVTEIEANVRAIEATEQYADGLLPRCEMKKARKAARLPWLPSYQAFDEALGAVRAAALIATSAQQFGVSRQLDDVAGHLGTPVTLRPSWLSRNGGIVAVMARTIYTGRSFADMPVLADALEEAGCDNPLILDHCRRPGEHLRGCWVLDLLLGKR